MKAITIEQYGGPEVLLKHDDFPMPEAGADDILIRLVCAGINFMDVHTRQGKYANSQTYPVRLPCTLGMEGAGEVIGVGANVRGFAIGDRVAWCIAWGSYAEYIAVPQHLVAHIPDGISYALAAASMFQGATAHYLMEDIARLNQDSSCLIHAASGSIGQLLVQMAKRRGATVFVTAGSEEKRQVALQRGADYAFDSTLNDFADQVRDATCGKGVDVVLDPIGKATLRQSFLACKKHGLIVNYGNVSGSLKDLDPIELGEAGSLFLTRPRLADHMSDRETVQRRADDVFAALQDGWLNIHMNGCYTFDDVEQAHALIEERKQIGKPILKIADD
ncbi:MAG TPA: quinone oxidoreductase [Noviherbaspirillum sp.]